MPPKKLSSSPQYWNGMIYAPPGAGKTTLFGTAQQHPDMQHVLFIDVEGGLSSVSHIDGILYERVGKDDSGKPNHRTCEDLERIFWSLVNKKKVMRRFKLLSLIVVRNFKVWIFRTS